MDQWVVEFDYRSDNGPRLVGPFVSKESGTSWARSLASEGFEASYSVAPMAYPT